MICEHKPAHICLALTISLAIGATGYGIAGVLNIPNYGILFITAIALLVANVFHHQLENLHGAFETGMLKNGNTHVFSQENSSHITTCPIR